MAEPRHITLRELQRAVKRTLEEGFELPVWVSAEIAEIKVNYSGHCYLELVEKGGANGVPTAQARAMIWSSSYPGLRLASSTKRDGPSPQDCKFWPKRWYRTTKYTAFRCKSATSTPPTRWAAWNANANRPSRNCRKRGSGR